MQLFAQGYLQRLSLSASCHTLEVRTKEFLLAQAADVQQTNPHAKMAAPPHRQFAQFVNRDRQCRNKKCLESLVVTGAQLRVVPISREVDLNENRASTNRLIANACHESQLLIRRRAHHLHEPRQSHEFHLQALLSKKPLRHRDQCRAQERYSKHRSTSPLHPIADDLDRHLYER